MVEFIFIYCSILNSIYFLFLIQLLFCFFAPDPILQRQAIVD